MSDLIEQCCPTCGGRCKQPLLPGAPLAVTDASFASAVQASALPVLGHFRAPWCGPCRTREPALEAVARDRAGRVQVAKVNVDESPALASRYANRSIPARRLFRGSEVVAEPGGAVPARTLSSFPGRHGV